MKSLAERKAELLAEAQKLISYAATFTPNERIFSGLQASLDELEIVICRVTGKKLEPKPLDEDDIYEHPDHIGA